MWKRLMLIVFAVGAVLLSTGSGEMENDYSKLPITTPNPSLVSALTKSGETQLVTPPAPITLAPPTYPPISDSSFNYEAAQEEVRSENQRILEKYNQEIMYLQSIGSVLNQSFPSWPDHKLEGWDVLDLSLYPLENPTAIEMNRSDLMANGMLLINETHIRPSYYPDTWVVRIRDYLGGDIQLKDEDVSIFPIAADALMNAFNDAKINGTDQLMVLDGYHSMGIASDIGSGLSFTLGLPGANNSITDILDFSNSSTGKWLNENCWKYGLIFRYPLSKWPLENNTDKSSKTGVSTGINQYRYVGKANAAVMYYFDLCLEEYVEFLQVYPHIAVFEDGILRYEICRQNVGDADSFHVQLTRNSSSWSASLDNLGGVITSFEY